MDTHEHAAARERAVAELKRRAADADAEQVVDSLAAGMRLLSDGYYARACLDVQRAFGHDSMVLRASPPDELTGKNEIDLYLTAESAHAVQEHGLLPDGQEWYAAWLAGMQLGEVAAQHKARKRLAGYAELPPDARRLAFSRVLDRALPDTRRAPLVLARLLPLAVGIVTATAFGDLDAARLLRKQQISLLPGIAECHQCRGRLMDNGETCPQCGNPMWKHNWLTS